MSKYGNKGQEWASDFVNYMADIVNHSNFSGMPDAIKRDGKIQWEAPTNRSSGEYQFTNQKRKEWWKLKAESIGIDTSRDKWISLTAKTIHPFGRKPCKRCGEWMSIYYVYPNQRLIKKINSIFKEEITVDTYDTIYDVLFKIELLKGNKAFSEALILLSIKEDHVDVQEKNIECLSEWLEHNFIPTEPSCLSPGAMSNAPDRLDGFHSFNKCCRSKADKGRSSANLRLYTSDRRVFEFWSEGDWVAADKMMGIVSSKYREYECADGGDGPPTADHIGPISLGFCHSPMFRLLSKSANSAKNNRMYYQDVKDLLLAEEKDELTVASWYASPMWDTFKHKVVDDETASRLSKIMRDNQRLAMGILSELLKKGHFSFLLYLLNLDFASYDVDFENIRVDNYIMKYDEIIRTEKDNSYVSEKQARRIRIGFDALYKYQRDNRHQGIFYNEDVYFFINSASDMLDSISIRHDDIIAIDNIFSDFMGKDSSYSEYRIKELTSYIDVIKKYSDEFEECKRVLMRLFSHLAKRNEIIWHDRRYVRNF